MSDLVRFLIILVHCVFVVFCAPLILSSTDSYNGDHNRKIPETQDLAFLKRYGYLDSGRGDADSLYKEEAIVEAIRTMQHYGNIPETGVIDNITIQLMTSRRCGVADIIRGNSTRSKRFIVGADGWNKRTVTYFLANWSPKLQGHTEVHEQLQKAFSMWSGYSRLHFQSVQTPEADIIVAFGRGYHGDMYPFDGQNGILAHAYFPYEMDNYGGDVHFDEDEFWAFKPKDTDTGVDFLTVAVHELGHSLGLAHSPVSSSVMFPYYKGYNEDLRLDYDDILAMYQLYIQRPLEDETVPEIPGVPQSTTSTTMKSMTSTLAASTTTSTGVTTAPSVSTEDYSSKDETSKHNEDDYTTVERHRNRTKPDQIIPSLCEADYNAIAQLRQELFVFKQQFMWRYRSRGDLDHGYPVTLHQMFPGLPEWVKSFDAVYERPTDGHLVFFTGAYYWVSDGDKFIDSPRPITEFGLPENITKIDAAFVWGKNGKTYLFSGSEYWRFVDVKKSLDHDTALSMSRWRGIPDDIDAVTTWKKQTYFFKGRNFWRFDDELVSIDERFPLDSAQYWFGC